MREAGVMLIVQDGLILAVSRRYDSTKFGLPGGKLELLETPKEAAIRETYEETGIKVTECTQIYRREEPPDSIGGEYFYAYAFFATSWEGVPHTSTEGLVKWISAKELTSSSGAFPDYNRATLDSMKKMFPNVYIKGE